VDIKISRHRDIERSLERKEEIIFLFKTRKLVDKILDFYTKKDGIQHKRRNTSQKKEDSLNLYINLNED